LNILYGGVLVAPGTRHDDCLTLSLLHLSHFLFLFHLSLLALCVDLAVDPSITQMTSGYLITQIPTNNPFLIYSTNFLFNAQNEFTFDFGNSFEYVLSGYLCVSVQLMMSTSLLSLFPFYNVLNKSTK
jgi:hypothetical protein